MKFLSDKTVKIMHLKMIIINKYYEISYFVASTVCTMMTPRLRLCVREGNYNEDQKLNLIPSTKVTSISKQIYSVR